MNPFQSDAMLAAMKKVNEIKGQLLEAKKELLVTCSHLHSNGDTARWNSIEGSYCRICEKYL
jgi:hypothetical protein